MQWITSYEGGYNGITNYAESWTNIYLHDKVRLTDQNDSGFTVSVEPVLQMETGSVIEISPFPNQHQRRYRLIPHLFVIK